MDLSKYVKETGYTDLYVAGEKEKVIDKEIIAELLGAENGRVKVFAVVASLYFNKKDIGGGFFSKAINAAYLLSKNYLPAEGKFNEFYKKLKDEGHWIIEEEIKSVLELELLAAKSFTSLNFAVFKLMYSGKIDFLEMGYSDGGDAFARGDKVMLQLNRASISLDGIQYSIKHKALCHVYECGYSYAFDPIVLD